MGEFAFVKVCIKVPSLDSKTESNRVKFSHFNVFFIAIQCGDIKIP